MVKKKPIRARLSKWTFMIPSLTGEAEVSVNSKREIEFGSGFDLEYEQSMIEFREEPSEAMKVYCFCKIGNDEVKEMACLAINSRTMPWGNIANLFDVFSSLGAEENHSWLPISSTAKTIIALTMSAKNRRSLLNRSVDIDPEQYALIIESIASRSDRTGLIIYGAQHLRHDLTFKLMESLTDAQRAAIMLCLGFSYEFQGDYILLRPSEHPHIVDAGLWCPSFEEFLGIISRGSDNHKQVAVRHTVIAKLSDAVHEPVKGFFVTDLGGIAVGSDMFLSGFAQKIFELIESIEDADIKFTTLCDFGTAFKEVIEQGLSEKFYEIFDKSKDAAWTLEKYEKINGYQKLPIRFEHAIIPRLPQRENSVEQTL